MSSDITQVQGENAADRILGIAQDVQDGYTTPERGRRLVEIATGHLSDDAKAVATDIVNQRTCG